MDFNPLDSNVPEAQYGRLARWHQTDHIDRSDNMSTPANPGAVADSTLVPKHLGDQYDCTMKKSAINDRSLQQKQNPGLLVADGQDISGAKYVSYFFVDAFEAVLRGSRPEKLNFYDLSEGFPRPIERHALLVLALNEIACEKGQGFFWCIPTGWPMRRERTPIKQNEPISWFLREEKRTHRPRLLYQRRVWSLLDKQKWTLTSPEVKLRATDILYSRPDYSMTLYPIQYLYCHEDVRVKTLTLTNHIDMAVFDMGRTFVFGLSKSLATNDPAAQVQVGVDDTSIINSWTTPECNGALREDLARRLANLKVDDSHVRRYKKAKESGNPPQPVQLFEHRSLEALHMAVVRMVETKHGMVTRRGCDLLDSWDPAQASQSSTEEDNEEIDDADALVKDKVSAEDDASIDLDLISLGSSTAASAADEEL